MKERLYALGAGVLCHSLFLSAIALMAYMLFWGMTRALIPIGGALGRICNLGLLVQFPVLHSWLLSRRGSKVLVAVHPEPYGKILVTTTFTTVASLQLLAVFLFWTPSARAWFTPDGPLFWAWSFTHILAWGFLLLALYDAGPSLQSGFLGWGAMIRGRAPRYASFPTKGLFRACRQPIYLGFLLVILTAPVWSLDHAVMALLWGAYCVAGAKLKERRFHRLFGEPFDSYCRQVPFFLPSWKAASSRGEAASSPINGQSSR